MDQQQYYKNDIINQQSSESNNTTPVEIAMGEQEKRMKSVHEE